ncbi:similar to Saccharomyces cerevisiae YER114C BOI2 Protein implicated in polar growth, functionally redundant with Boi1p [Maudiozyma saulgeensis]|uniref:Similar to Saccharomyces cerevisiae YER114C BOI2 Protein implicated in polar growth, functionally redundant with Boi1p n=1 Tax=Maudiozyma saulgeensis TaxID=1789683 RepID=A0A1X7R4H8_9SACH|nr:similar to Saccharomyces cerevisiae YER114C BOI2 Protein implicated in polar growth, functionally redundant with Boi1p [Kazachstania saulgeensis]
MSGPKFTSNTPDPSGTILIATKSYSRRMDDEITIKPGNKIEVITNDEEFNDGWYVGRNIETGQEGLFPRLFTERYIKPTTRDSIPERQERIVSVKNTMEDIDNALAALRNSSLDMLSTEQVMSNNTSDLRSYDLNDNDSASLYTPGLQIDETEQIPPLKTPSTFNGNKEDVVNWTPSQVTEYFHSKGFEQQVASKFEMHGINGKKLLELQLSNLKKIEINSFGARFEVFKVIDALRAPVIRPATPVHHTMPTDGLAISSETDIFESPGRAPNPPSYPSPVQPLVSPSLNNRNSMMASSPTLRYPSQDYFKYPPISEEGNGPNTINGSSYNFPRTRSPALSPQHTRSSSTSSSFNNNDNGNVSTVVGSRDVSSYVSKSMSSTTGPVTSDSTKNVMLRQSQHRKTASGGSFVDLFKRISMLSTNDEDFEGDNTLTNAYNNTSNHPTRPSSTVYHSSHSRNVSEAKYHHHSTSTSKHHPRTPSTSNFMNEHSRSPSKTNINMFTSGAHSRTPSGINNHITHSRTPSGINYKDTHLRTPSGINYTSNNGSSGQRHSHMRTPSGTTNDGGHSRSASGIKSHIRGVSQGNSEIKKSRRSSVLSFLSPSKKDNDTNLTKLDSYPSNRESLPNNNRKISHSRKSSAAINSVRHQSLSNDAANTTIGTITSSASKPKLPLQKKVTGDNAKSKGMFTLQPSAKKQTSAFQEGIRTISVDKAIKSAECAGWMSKKGSGAMGVWKTRFFTLHRNRLSYFSNTTEGKEKGLIDITGHKVVPIQDDDTLISLYAASIGRGKYFFKLVPPQPGFKKGLTFTQPRVHYFAVDSKEEMRQWVAALIKANIEVDDSTPIICSYNMPTVSLSKAQAMLKEAKKEMSERDKEQALHEADEDEVMWEEQNKRNQMQAAGFI